MLTAVRMKLFDALAEAKDGQITVEELAKKTNAEVAFTSKDQLPEFPAWTMN